MDTAIFVVLLIGLLVQLFVLFILSGLSFYVKSIMDRHEQMTMTLQEIADRAFEQSHGRPRTPGDIPTKHVRGVK